MSLKLSESKEVVRCCYKISDTDVECLFKLVEIGRPISAEELASLMKLSKTTVENSLKKLIEIGLVVRNKDGEEGKRIGRPRYLYAIIHNVDDKIKQDLTNCATKILSATSS
ncbi:helix-turn-helix domain-containing protein [Sulfolobus tengchongensis]|uniref:Helix-turn-helix domain-containing protein n=1 Tax=Sulfolobus tengchongensis TaxID=207809 RepID=A0AAX4L1Z2_9CREN